MINVVIHPDIVFMEAVNPQRSADGLRRAESAKRVIEDILANDPDAMRIDGTDVTTPAKLLSSGNAVMLYGCYLGNCLKTACDALQDKGIEAHYHPTGCISLE